MIEQHIELLLEADPFFRSYWESLTAEVRQTRLKVVTDLERLCDPVVIFALHEWTSEKTRRYLSCVPQVDFDYNRRPKHWLDLIGNEYEMRCLFDRSHHVISAFCQTAGLVGRVRLYGGIKPTGSLDAGFEQPKANWAQRRRLRDTWDAVRFRLVCEDLVTLRVVCLQLWQYFIDEVVKCRNYYVSCGGTGTSELYRAVHFELEVESNRWIELQVLTELRDLMGFLDYSFPFKKRLRFLDRNHEEWLTGLSAKANIADARTVHDRDVLIPGPVALRFADLRLFSD